MKTGTSKTQIEEGDSYVINMSEELKQLRILVCENLLPRITMVTSKSYSGPVQTVVPGTVGRVQMRHGKVTWTYCSGPVQTVVPGTGVHV